MLVARSLNSLLNALVALLPLPTLHAAVDQLVSYREACKLFPTLHKLVAVNGATLSISESTLNQLAALDLLQLVLHLHTGSLRTHMLNHRPNRVSHHSITVLDHLALLAMLEQVHINHQWSQLLLIILALKLAIQVPLPSRCKVSCRVSP